MPGTVTLTIDGATVRAPEGTSVLDAALEAGICIPNLCHMPGVTPLGACRVCIVEVEGMKNYVASCVFPVSDGMKIHTNTQALRRARRDIIELILDNHPLDCHTCERDGNCELQRLASSMGIRNRHFEGEKKHYEKDLSSDAVIRDPDKCIL